MRDVCELTSQSALRRSTTTKSTPACFVLMSSATASGSMRAGLLLGIGRACAQSGTFVVQSGLSVDITLVAERSESSADNLSARRDVLPLYLFLSLDEQAVYIRLRMRICSNSR